MKFIIRGKNLEVTDSIKSYIEEKIGKLDKYFEKPGELTANVIVRVKGKDQIVEVTIPAKKIILRGEESNDDLYASIDLVSDKLERLKSLNGGKVSLVEDESIEDTLIDLANYAVMALIEIRDFKEKTDAEVHKRLKRNNEEKSDDYIEFESIAKNYGDELRNYLKERDEY